MCDGVLDVVDTGDDDMGYGQVNAELLDKGERSNIGSIENDNTTSLSRAFSQGRFYDVSRVWCVDLHIRSYSLI